MDRLLDKEIHQLFKLPIPSSFYVTNPGRTNPHHNNNNNNLNQPEQAVSQHQMGKLQFADLTSQLIGIFV